MSDLKRKEWLRQVGTGIASRRVASSALSSGQQALIKEYMREVADIVPEKSIVVDLDCAGRSYWDCLSGNKVKILGASDKKLETGETSSEDCRIISASPDEFSFLNVFDGVLSLRFFEGVFPEYWSRGLRKIYLSLKPGGVVFFLNAISEESPAYENFGRLRSRGMPVVVGEYIEDESNLYSFRPLVDWARHWIAGAGFSVVEEAFEGNLLFSLVRRL